MAEAQCIELVVPFYNPPLGWEVTVSDRIKRLQASFPSHLIRLILVDDGSAPQHALEQAFEKLHAEGLVQSLIRLPINQGKGQALRRGIAASKADFVLYTDVDIPYDIPSMVAVIRQLEAGSDVVLGYREQDYYASVPWFRKGLSELFRFVLKGILNFPITDTQCGLKGMNRMGKEVFLETTINRFLVDMEFIKQAVRRKALRVTPVVVHLREGVSFSRMGFAVLFQEGLNFMKLLLR